MREELRYRSVLVIGSTKFYLRLFWPWLEDMIKDENGVGVGVGVGVGFGDKFGRFFSAAIIIYLIYWGGKGVKIAPNTLFYLYVGRFRYYDIILTSLFLDTYCTVVVVESTQIRVKEHPRLFR